MLDVCPRTVSRWESETVSLPLRVIPALREILAENRKPEKLFSFTFADLFSGIGGIRLPFETRGGRCVFSCEWNSFSLKTYQNNFSFSHEIAGDITKVDQSKIPDHDVLLAGFPCQPFSIAGVSKKNSMGKAHGFKCKSQGSLFFDVARIIHEKKPRAFLLENVKNLVSHDRGKTFQTILDVLEQQLGYNVFWKIINAKHFVPQNRARVIVVGFLENNGFSWENLEMPETSPVLGNILHPEDGSEKPDSRFTLGKEGKVNDKYILSDRLWKYLKDYAEKQKRKGNGFGYGLFGKKDIARTLSARYYKDGSEILVSRKKGNPRKLTPRECARLMGFPDFFSLEGVSDTQLYRQFGNSVAVPVIDSVAKIMLPFIANRQGNG